VHLQRARHAEAVALRQTLFVPPTHRLKTNDITTIGDVAGKRVCMQTGFYE
jgi:hypothetical protein